MKREVLAQLAGCEAEALAAQEERRQEGAAGDHHALALHPQPCAALGFRLDRVHAPARELEPLGPAAHVRGRTGVPRAWNVGQAHVQLRRRRAPERANARADAARGVAEDEVARPAELFGASSDHERVVAREVFRHLRHVQLALDAAEVGIELVGAQSPEAEALAPALEDQVGRAKAGAGVDERRAGDALAERQQDRGVPNRGRLPRVAIELGRHLTRARAEVVGRPGRAALEHHNRHAALGQLFRHRRAACARADHANVGADRAVAGDGRAILDALDARLVGPGLPVDVAGGHARARRSPSPGSRVHGRPAAWAGVFTGALPGLAARDRGAGWRRRRSRSAPSLRRRRSRTAAQRPSGA